MLCIPKNLPLISCAGRIPGEYLADSAELVRPLHHWVFEASRGWAVQAAERVSGDGVILGPRVECHLQLFNKGS